MSIDYTTVTEVPGNLVSREAMDMAFTRYTFAAAHCAGNSVLEVACGPGPGLGVLRAHAARVVAGDFTAGHLKRARDHYGAALPLVRLDAHALPFAFETFDTIILFEAIYFLSRSDAFVAECRRVLKPGGALLVSTVNPEWAAFNPAPFSTSYPTAAALRDALESQGLRAEIYGGFPGVDDGLKGRVVDRAKRVAVALHLIPKTMKGKELLKRIAFGRLEPFPAQISAATGAFRAPVRLEAGADVARFKVLYAVGHKDESRG